MTELEQRTIEMLNSNEQKYENLRRKWEKLYARYNNEVRPGSITEKTESKVRLAQAFSIVEQSAARSLAQAPRFQFESRKGKNYEAVQKYQQFSSFQWDKNGADKVIEDIYRWGVITGLSGWKVGWKIKKKIVNKKSTIGFSIENPIHGEVSIKTKKNVELVSNNWDIQAIKPFDLLWNDEATGLEDVEMLAHRETRTLKQLEFIGFDAKKLRNSILNNQSYWDKQLDDFDHDQKSRMVDNMALSVYECYVTDFTGGVLTEKVVFIAGGEGIDGGKTPLETMDNPFDDKFKAIGIFRPIVIPGKFYGYGLIEPVEHVLDAEEDTFNMTTEALWTDISRPMEFNPANLLEPDSIEFGPRVLIPVKHIGESVGVLPTPSPDMAGAANTLGFLERSKQNVTAITDYQTGADQAGGQKTLGEIEIKTIQSDQRSTKLLKSLEYDLLQPLGKAVLSLNKQYLAGDKKITFTTTTGKGQLKDDSINFNEIDSIQEVKVLHGSTASVMRNQELNKWNQFFNMGAQAMQMGVQVDLQEIFRSMVEEGLDVSAPEKYLPSLKEQEKGAVDEQMAQLEAAKAENADPRMARVQESDNHKIHIQIHQAAVKAGGNGQKQYSPEELQMLTSHINQHVEMAGGAVPVAQQAVDQGVAQQVGQAVAPQQSQQ